MRMLLRGLQQDTAHPNTHPYPALPRPLIDEPVLFGSQFERGALGFGFDGVVRHRGPNRMLIGCFPGYCTTVYGSVKVVRIEYEHKRMTPPTHIPSPPTRPPPFGRPVGHVGGSYDWWWWNFGRPAGTPYEPTVVTEDGYWVWGRGCTQPGGGIVPGWGFVPHFDSLGRSSVVGFGDEEILAPAPKMVKTPSPWTVAVATTVLGAATGWVIEEVARMVRGKRQ